MDKHAFKPVTTERLLLRRLELSDCGGFFAYRSLPEVYRFQSFRPCRPEEAEAFIKGTAEYPDIPGTWLQLAVCLKDTGVLAGDVGIHFLEDGDGAEIGYTLSPGFQGKGYAQEAVKAVLEYLFSVLGKHRVTASVDPENGRSIALLKKLGMRQEAHFIKSVKTKDGGWADDCVYALLQSEWNASRYKNTPAG
jgi:RimJ/RimL family protein N-acetyltransferase